MLQATLRFIVNLLRAIDLVTTVPLCADKTMLFRNSRFGTGTASDKECHTRDVVTCRVPSGAVVGDNIGHRLKLS